LRGEGIVPGVLDFGTRKRQLMVIMLGGFPMHDAERYFVGVLVEEMKKNPWSKFLFENLIIAKLVKKFPAF
jgi:hypothetical protein